MGHRDTPMARHTAGGDVCALRRLASRSAGYGNIEAGVKRFREILSEEKAPK